MRSTRHQSSSRRRVLIIFPYINLAFSPTVINLYDALKAHCDVSILSLEPSYFSEQRLRGRTVEYVRYPRLLRRVCESLKFHLGRFGLRIDFPAWVTALLLLRKARHLDCDEAIGVDFSALWVAQKVFHSTHLLSLEIYEHDTFYQRVNHARICSVIIQTTTRYEHLFGQQGPRYFLVQNAPVYKPLITQATPQGLIFCGTALPSFGVFRCLDFIAKFPEFHLTFKGAVPRDVRAKMEDRYRELLTRHRVKIDDTYLEAAELQMYLSRFLIGLCCYDFTFPQIDTFNYRTAPSGKLFAYFAAGVPVIGSDIPGLTSVREFNAGVLIETFSPDAIRNAIEQILVDHAAIRENCQRAARHFSFDRAVKPFEEFITGKRPVASAR